MVISIDVERDSTKSSTHDKTSQQTKHKKQLPQFDKRHMKICS